MNSKTVTLGDVTFATVTSETKVSGDLCPHCVITVDYNREVLADFIHRTGDIDAVMKAEEDIVALFCAFLGAKPGRYAPR